MADLSITPQNVQLMASSTQTVRGIYGETVTQGQAVYLKESDGRWWKADADLSTAAAAAGGIALTPGAAGETGIIVTSGKMDVGATLTVGEIYVLSSTAGGICPEADLSTGENVTILGVASAADTLDVQIKAFGVPIP